MQRISITNPQNIIDGTAKKYYFKLRNTGGPKGDKGDKGDTGATGPQGPQGNAATVSVGSTTTLPVGYDATVTNTGSIYNAVLDFGIPQGPQGPQGAKGDKGDTGAKGDTGPRGPQGERGTNATVYVGTTTTTNPGTQARVYNSGTDSNAVLNFEIPRGDVGPMPTIAQTTGQSTTEVMSQKATTDALNTKQNALTAGQGIDITSDVISTPALVPEVVASLPAEGTEGKLYLTPKAHTTSTATGNPITATVAEQAGKIESFQLDGDTFQQTYSGKNLLPIEITLGAQGITANYDQNTGLITVGGTPTVGYPQLSTIYNLPSVITSGTNIVFSTTSVPTGVSRIFIRFYQETGTTHTDYNLTTANPSKAITAGADWHRVMLILEATSGTAISGTFGLQIETGTSATDFEKFVGGQASPNPDYPQVIQTVTGEQTVTIVGKNLLNVKDNLKTSASGLDFSFSDNKLVVSGTPTATYANVTNKIDVDLPAGDYTLSISNTVNHRVYLYVDYEDSTTDSLCVVNAGSTSRTATFAKRAVKIRLDFSYMTTGTALNESFAIQLEAGSTASSFAPYHATDYPINLGKNLFDKNNATISHFYPHVSEIRQNNSAVSIVLPVEAGTTYTASTTNRSLLDSTPAVACTDHLVTSAPDSFLSRTQWGSGDSVSFTAPAGAKYMYIYVKWTTDATAIANILATIQVEKGSQATTYAPYFTPIELCKLGTYRDYIYKDGDDWKVHKKILKTIFENDTGWDWDPSVPRLAYNTANLHIILPPNQRTNAYGLSSKYVARSFEYVYTNKNAGFALSQSGFLSCVDKSWTSEAQAKATIAGTVFYFALRDAFVTDTTITDTTLIQQLEAIRTAALENGANTISNAATGSNLAGDMEISYYGYNPTNRYDKFIWLDINDNYEQIGE